MRVCGQVLCAALAGLGCGGGGQTSSGTDDPPNDVADQALDTAWETSGDALNEGFEETDACIPGCQYRKCGPDGCGGSCGECGGTDECVKGHCCTQECSADDVLPCKDGKTAVVCKDSDGDACLERTQVACPRSWTCAGSGPCAPAKCDATDCPMVEVPGGQFWMGCNKDGTQCPTNAVEPECGTTALPCHEVTLPAFRIDKFEVTVSAYRACMDLKACTSTDDGKHCSIDDANADDHPIDCVEWPQAKAYCEWAGRRLCTEAEWEKAARGTDGRLYPWGNQPATCQYAIMDDGTGSACGGIDVQPVGSRPAGASPYGAMDMIGNAAEWLGDTFVPSYEGAPTDGSAWEVAGIKVRCARGGGPNTVPEATASARAGYPEPSSSPTAPKAGGGMGFRCCASGPAAPSR